MTWDAFVVCGRLHFREGPALIVISVDDNSGTAGTVGRTRVILRGSRLLLAIRLDGSHFNVGLGQQTK